MPALRKGGLLLVTCELTKDGFSAMIGDIAKHFAADAEMEGRDCSCRPVVREESYPAPWQAWRIEVDASRKPREFELVVACVIPEGVVLTWNARIVQFYSQRPA